MAGEDGGRIYQPPTAAAVVDGHFPGETAIDGSLTLIASVDNVGPEPFNAVIATSPAMMADDWPVPRGPLRGLPVLLKDNIETADMPTTAGSLALVDNAPGRDAPLVTRLREAGAAILLAGFYFRAIDQDVCGTFPLGTHFMWHVLIAVMLAVNLTGVARHGAPRRVV